jgi:transposase-like protein
MGDRYFLTVTCPKCGLTDSDVYFAPTCGFKKWKCKCGKTVDLEKLTGITEEMASNKNIIQAMCDSFKKEAVGEEK